ncbi:MAG: hypothetical protein LBS01_07925 [Prevotellaceae bacterium]|jgi:hypothetical protein|nr:hypothetical protein [Prevotellaceae bacterium]
MENAVFFYKNQIAISAFLMMSIVYEASDEKSKMIRYSADVQRGKLQVLRRGGGMGNNALVCYENLPDDYKAKIQRVIPDPFKAAQRNEVEALIEHNGAISDFYSEYEVEEGVKLKSIRVREYYNNAIVMVALGKLYREKRSYKKVLKIRQFWKWAAQQVTDLDRTKYAHNLPLNPLKLQHKYNAFFDATQFSDNFSYNLESVMKLGRFGVKTAAKVKDEIQESVLFELLKNNVDDVLVCDLYNYKAKQEGWKAITASSVGNWRVKWQMELHAARYGTTSFYNKVAMQHKRKRPEFPLYYWTMDGWDAELYYQETKIDKNGHSVTTYNNRATIYIVLDASINYPIGFAVGKSENGELIKAAMKNAVNHTAQLFGQRYSPQQLQSDRFGIKKITDLSEKGYTNNFTPARAKNAKAKVVEPYNLYLNKTYCRMFANWSGFGVKTSNDRQPNAEILNLNKKSFPTYEDLVKQLEQIIAFERGKKMEQYLSLWSVMPIETRLPMSDEKYLLMFGKSSAERELKGGNDGRILLQGNGLILTLNGQKYTYDCFDIEFRRNAATRWEIYFDEQDMSHAVAVNEDGTRRFMLEEKYTEGMDDVSRTYKDIEQGRKIERFNKQLQEHIIDFHAKMEKNVKQTGAPKLIESLFVGASSDKEFIAHAVESEKTLLTDSKGQHKQNRYLEHEKRRYAEVEMMEQEQECYVDLY